MFRDEHDLSVYYLVANRICYYKSNSIIFIIDTERKGTKTD